MPELHLISVKSLEALISACRKGDRTAQRELFEALSPRMYAVCLRYAGNADDAKDILQDGFVTVFSKLDSYSGSGSFEGWARKIFVNTALMHLRKNDALRMSDDIAEARDLSAREATPLEEIGYRQLIGLISSLPGYSHKEIARQLGIPEATSRSKLQRARVQLQEMIKKLRKNV